MLHTMAIRTEPIPRNRYSHGRVCFECSICVVMVLCVSIWVADGGAVGEGAVPGAKAKQNGAQENGAQELIQENGAQENGAQEHGAQENGARELIQQVLSKTAAGAP